MRQVGKLKMNDFFIEYLVEKLQTRKKQAFIMLLYIENWSNINVSTLYYFK